jgi:hypothetical protein
MRSSTPLRVAITGWVIAHHKDANVSREEADEA